MRLPQEAKKIQAERKKVREGGTLIPFSCVPPSVFLPSTFILFCSYASLIPSLLCPSFCNLLSFHAYRYLFLREPHSFLLSLSFCNLFCSFPHSFAVCPSFSCPPVYLFCSYASLSPSSCVPPSVFLLTFFPFTCTFLCSSGNLTPFSCVPPSVTFFCLPPCTLPCPPRLVC